MAQVVLKAAREFHGLGIGQRLAYVATHPGPKFTEDQFWERRGSVIEQVAAKLEEALAEEAAAAFAGNPSTQDNPVADPDAAKPTSARTRPGRRRLILTGATVATVVLAVVAAVVLTRDNSAHATWNGMSAAQLEQRYDGKLPQGQEGQESHCADPPPSQPIDGASPPSVIGPDGTEVAKVHLRKSKSPTCPTVVWARVVWYDDENRTFTIPPGWTLHVVMTRPDTKSTTDETEPQHGPTIHYAYSRMMTSATGCVYAQAYFTKGDAPPPTEVVPTSCVQV
jgi:hypothetical protein